MSSRYEPRHLAIAKCVVVVLIALAVGPRLADGPGEIPITIFVVLVLVGALFGAYEALSHGVAILLARPSRAGPEVPAHLAEGQVEPPQNSGRLRRRDIVIALVAFLGAQALVWIIAGAIVAGRIGETGDRASLIRELVQLVPVALPGSLIVGGAALLIVLRGWKKRLGVDAWMTILGLSWGRSRQMLNGILSGVGLALFILPLFSLVANRPEPPDLITQLALSSNATLRAWLISAVLLAPPIEELMFRGALFGGLATTWNVRGAAVVSGATFWVMHGPEFVHWPAAVAIALLTALATWLRVRSGSLWPSVAAHFGYNLVLATVMSLAVISGTKGTRWALAGPQREDGKLGRAAETSRYRGSSYTSGHVQRREGVVVPALQEAPRSDRFHRWQEGDPDLPTMGVPSE